MSYIRIDAPSLKEGPEPRCLHEMVADWCSICKGLPDVPVRLPFAPDYADAYDAITVKVTTEEPVA